MYSISIDYYIKRGSPISLSDLSSWFSCGYSILVELEFVGGFCGGRKTGDPEEKPWEQGEHQHKINPHMA